MALLGSTPDLVEHLERGRRHRRHRGQVDRDPLDRRREELQGVPAELGRGRVIDVAAEQ